MRQDLGQYGLMDRNKRVALTRAALSGYSSGPDATQQARARAMQSLAESSVVILVEGVSDQIAVETLAIRHCLDLQGAGVTVLPAGGASEMVKLAIAVMNDASRSPRLMCLCDVAEEPAVRGGVQRAVVGGFGPGPETGVRFFVCDQDLEEELIRASGVDNVIAIIESQGDLRSLQKLQLQQAWRDRPVDQQLRRFMGSGARRKLRYARLLAGSIDIDRTPPPLAGLLDEL